VDVGERASPDELGGRVPKDPFYGRADVAARSLGVEDGDDVRGVLDQGAEARLAGAHPVVEPRPPDGHVDLFAERQHQPEVHVGQPGSAGGLDVKHADDAALVAEGHAHLRDDPREGGEEVRVGSAVLEQHRDAGPGHPAHDPPLDGDAIQHPVVADLVLEHERVPLEAVEADQGVVERFGRGVDDGTDEDRQVQLPGQRGAGLVQ
jgi:hypothetical protein